MKLHHKSVDWFKPDPRNPRKHPVGQIEKIERTIASLGFRVPVLADESGHLIAGHGRLEAAKRLGIEKIPCIVLSGMTEAQKKALALADNRLGLDAKWDEDLLRRMIEEAVGGDLEPEDFGFSEAEVEALVPDDEAEPDLLGADDIAAEFIVTISGPLAAQADVLRRLRELPDIPGVVVDVSALESVEV